MQAHDRLSGPIGDIHERVNICFHREWKVISHYVLLAEKFRKTQVFGCHIKPCKLVILFARASSSPAAKLQLSPHHSRSLHNRHELPAFPAHCISQRYNLLILQALSLYSFSALPPVRPHVPELLTTKIFSAGSSARYFSAKTRTMIKNKTIQGHNTSMTTSAVHA